MIIQVNGVREKALESSLSDFLKNNEWDTEKIVIELNGRIIPVEDYATTLLHEGDSMEIVQFVGGG